jgi:hypothetical protein
MVFWKVHSDFCFAADEAKADGKMSQVGRSREIKWGLSILEEPAVSARAGQVHTVNACYFSTVGVDRKKALFFLLFFWEGLSLQAKQRSAPPQKPRACLSQAPTKRGVCASLPAALLPVGATHVATAREWPDLGLCLEMFDALLTRWSHVHELFYRMPM